MLYKAYLSFFSSLIHQMKIVHPWRNHPSVMIIKQKYHDPMHNSPSPILPDACMQKGGHICWIL